MTSKNLRWMAITLKTRIFLAVSVILISLGIFFPVYNILGYIAIMISIAPVIVIAWFWGRRIAVLAALLFFPVDIFLSYLAGEIYANKSLGIAQNLLATVFAITIGFIVGSLHDSLKKMHRQVEGNSKMHERLVQEHKKLNIYVAKLNKLQEEREQFTSIAAHELKAPIVPIKGFLRLMGHNSKKYGLNKKAREYIRICLRNTARLEQLVQDILDIQKLESLEMKFNMQSVDLTKLLMSTVSEFKPSAKEKRLHISVNLPKSLPRIFGDPQRLLQVTRNLLHNAIKFTYKGSITISVQISDNYVIVRVTDTGIGIRKEDMLNLFTKFFQAQDVVTRKIKGTGLGLAICKQIINRHRGDIWAESELGKGSSFYFTLPIMYKLLPS